VTVSNTTTNRTESNHDLSPTSFICLLILQHALIQLAVGRFLPYGTVFKIAALLLLIVSTDSLFCPPSLSTPPNLSMSAPGALLAHLQPMITALLHHTWINTGFIHLAPLLFAISLCTSRHRFLWNGPGASRVILPWAHEGVFELPGSAIYICYISGTPLSFLAMASHLRSHDSKNKNLALALSLSQVSRNRSLDSITNHRPRRTKELIYTKQRK
jgi:hypothetical protein